MGGTVLTDIVMKGRTSMIVPLARIHPVDIEHKAVFTSTQVWLWVWLVV